MLLIIGSTGKLGREITKKCIERKIPTRCLVRKTSDLSIYDSSKVELVYGDILDKDSLDKASVGVETVIDVVSLRRQTDKLTHEMIDHGGIKNIISVAQKNNIKHIIYTSVLGVEPNSPVKLWSAKWNAEQALINSGIPYTIFRPSGFFTDYTDFLLPRIKETRSHQIIKGSCPGQPIAPTDLAEMYAQAVNNEKTKYQIYNAGGPEVFASAETARIIGDALGIDVDISFIDSSQSQLPPDWLYILRKPSVCTDEQNNAVRKTFNINFIKFSDWLKKAIKEDKKE